MASTPRRVSEYPGVFGFRHPEYLESRAKSDGHSVATDQASNLAQQFGFPDVGRLEHELHCLAEDWVTGQYMHVLADANSLEYGRERIRRAVVRLLAELVAAPLVAHRLAQHQRHVEDWDLERLCQMLQSLEDAAARPPDKAYRSKTATPQRNSDVRRYWIVLGIMLLYENETKKTASAYSDDGERVGNDGAKFICEVYSLITGKEIRMSAVERFLRRSNSETVLGQKLRHARPSK